MAKSLYSIFRDVMNAKCIEPHRRNKDGMRWIAHRFPIKGGISWRDVMLRGLGNIFVAEDNGEMKIGSTLRICLPR